MHIEAVEGISIALHLGSGRFTAVIVLVSSMSRRSRKKKKNNTISGGGGQIREQDNFWTRVQNQAKKDKKNSRANSIHDTAQNGEKMSVDLNATKSW